MAEISVERHRQARGRRVGRATAAHLVQRYGRHALKVAEYARADPALAAPLAAGEPDIRAEIVYQREHEMAVRPEDHLFRRTRLGLFGVTALV